MAVIDEIENTPQAWSARAALEPTSWAAAGWTRDGQLDRLEAALNAARPQPEELLLDYGCGTGAFVDLLAGIPGLRYVGYDSAPGMVERARREHPGRHFQTWEPYSLAPDVTVCVGPFNLPGGWTKQHTFATVRRLWDVTSRVLVASLYAGTDQRCLVYTRAELERFAAAESYRWNVIRHRPNDLLLVLCR